MGKYYKNLLEILNSETNKQVLFEKLIHPLSFYLVCTHYCSDETEDYGLFLPSTKKNLLLTKDTSVIKEYDFIYVQNKYLHMFCVELLPKINKMIVLLTGQVDIPALEVNSITEYILEHENIIVWAAQNPIFPTSSKYMALPYGLSLNSLNAYADSILKYQNENKDKEVIVLPMNRNTNECRRRFLEIPRLESEEYFCTLAKARFVLSPIGDRDDCYRHYEAIGLGTIPISNVSKIHRDLFGTNMKYCTIDEMVEIYKEGVTGDMYHIPNKDFVCFDYHKDILLSRVSERKRELNIPDLQV